MLTKRLIAGLLAVLLCFSLVACNTKPPAESTSDTADANATNDSTAGSTSNSTAKPTTQSSTSQSTSGTTYPTLPTENPTPTFPSLVASNDDLESVQVGKYVTLRYNANAAEVTYEAVKGVGSRETVTVTVKARNGYTFDGFTKDDAIANGRAPVSTDTTYTFTANAAMKLFVNSSFTVNYHANGGEFANGFDGTDTSSAVFYLNPATVHDNGSFEREGYTLIGYNTKEDGTGEYVALGSRVRSYGKGTIDLWCVWTENTPADQFTYDASGSGVVITKYNGTAETVTIPETIEGKKVTEIASDAFLDNTTVKMIVVGKTVKTIRDNAFNNCSALETVILWDAAFSGSSWTGGSLSDYCITDCSAFQTVHINTVYTMNSDWTSCGAAKFDRLLWAKDKKKVIIVGGSGSLFGFDCAVLDAALGGEYEIVNLGENAQITALMYFDVIEEFITEGDIVLWCPEPGSWTLGSENCHSRLWDFRKSDYGFTQHLTLSYYSNFFSSFAASCSKLQSASFKAFDQLSSSMSKYGDDRSPRKSKNETYDYNFDYSISAVEAMSEVFTNIKNKGGRIFFSFAAMQDTGSWNTSEADVKAYEKMITDLPGVTSISEYEGCIYLDKYFYDSAWHLTDEGGTVRASFVAQDILRALGKIE
ncbi:MAG: leucine-rich repeat protein [Clostridia bacterium]|nr:leucine-rich repeat protein [Clostridia bacterium]